MVSEAFSSFLSNVRQKTTNPFLGTLIIVWSISNWELLYSIFTFDSFMTLDARVARVKAYTTTHDMFWNLVCCIFEAVLVLIFTYLFLNASRGIVNFYEYRITPWVYKWTNPKSIVTIDIHNSIVEDRDNWANLYEKERTEKLRIQNNFEVLTKKQIERDVLITKDNENLKISNQGFAEEIGELTNNLKICENKLIAERVALIEKESFTKNTISEFQKKVKDLEDKLVDFEFLFNTNWSSLMQSSILKKLYKEILDKFPGDLAFFDVDENQIFMASSEIPIVKYSIENEIVKVARPNTMDNVLSLRLTKLGYYLKLVLTNRYLNPNSKKKKK